MALAQPAGGPRQSLAAEDREADRLLLARVAEGDALAFRQLYRDHAARALAIAVRVLKQVEDAEEVVQETFFELWTRSARFDPGRGGAVAWVVTIARSRAIDRLRAEASAGRALEAAAEELKPEPARGPEDLAAMRHDWMRVRLAMCMMPRRERVALELTFFEGLTQVQIAEWTREPLGTVKMRVRVGMQRLSMLLAPRG